MTRWHPPEGELRSEIPISLLACELASEPTATGELTSEPRAIGEAMGVLPGPLAALLARLPTDGVLKLQADSNPAELCAHIEKSGAYACRACPASAGSAPSKGKSRSVEVRCTGAAEILDLRDLEAPEPAHRILEAVAALGPGAALLARVPRFPRMLLPQLEQRGLAFEIFEEPDESALVHVRRPA